MRACNGGHSGVAEALLSAGADCNASDSNGWTSLIRAAMGGHEETVMTLPSSSSVLVDLKTQTGWTALVHAAKNGHEACVGRLLEEGASASVSWCRRYNQIVHRMVVIDFQKCSRPSVDLEGDQWSFGYGPSQTGKDVGH